MKNKKIYNFVDLFCGAGGFSEGFIRNGFRSLLALDNNINCIETIKSNNRDTLSVCTNIKNLKKSDYKELIQNKKIHLIIGGPPCQGFSMAGKRDVKDPRNSLFMEFVKSVKFLKPQCFVLENVRGLLSMKTNSNEKVIEIIEKEFRNIGYKSYWKVLNSANYGVPQKRNRLFIIGTLKDNPLPDFPIPTHFETTTDIDNYKLWVPVKDVLEDENEINPKYFHSDKMIKGFINRKKNNLRKKVGFGPQYLDLDKPSYTISARYWKDGSDALVKYSNNKIRMLSPKEVSRIQTFPENYIFKGTIKDIYMQIGNAVPCDLASAIAKNIKLYLDRL